MVSKLRRLPTYFIPHGGGPWPFIELPAEQRSEHQRLAHFLRGLLADVGRAPRAILMISGHWEERRPTVMQREVNELLFDYSGFPPSTYELHYPAPGSLELARRVQDLLGAGFSSATDQHRGLDHGAFVPLMLIVPDASIPVVQLSLVNTLDPETHLGIGRALAALRDEDILILASGMSYHNMREFFQPSESGEARGSRRFDTWLTRAVVADPYTRAAQLAQWQNGDDARVAQPREEHLIPLMVAAGAAENDPGRRVYSGQLFHAYVSGYRFG
ncbi:MAG TPA: class III extradiol ring-cleavage dioxygenase [Candidatus Acidoferrales bacterium]|nr:class III extradiol ring-cleavage dioxygenase [Candidatus Acidoferrales bacterium]